MPSPILPEFNAPTKRSRTADILRAAVNAGRPLPLAMMLKSMWRCRDEAIRLEGPHSCAPGYEPMTPADDAALHSHGGVDARWGDGTPDTDIAAKSAAARRSREG